MSHAVKVLRDSMKDSAVFHCPSAPHQVPANHAKAKQLGAQVSKNSRMWYKDFNKVNSSDFDQYLMKFVEKNVQGPVDVVLGYSMGGMAIGAMFHNKVFKHQQMKFVRAAVFVHSGGSSDWDIPRNLKTLHVIGEQDAVVEPEVAEDNAKFYTDPIVFKHSGDHWPALPDDASEVAQSFLLSLRDGHHRASTCDQLIDGVVPLPE